MQGLCWHQPQARRCLWGELTGGAGRKSAGSLPLPHRGKSLHRSVAPPFTIRPHLEPSCTMLQDSKTPNYHLVLLLIHLCLRWTCGVAHQRSTLASLCPPTTASSRPGTKTLLYSSECCSTLPAAAKLLQTSHTLQVFGVMRLWRQPACTDLPSRPCRKPSRV